MKALDTPEEKPLDSEIRLTLLLQADPEYKDGKDRLSEWKAARLNRVQRWLTTWQRLRQAKGSLPAVLEMPEVNVDVPDGSGASPGDPPEMIRDPILRKQYEDAIAKNNERARAHLLKRDIANLETAFVGSAKRYVMNAYVKPPFDSEEMERTLDQYGVDKETRTAMVSEVQRRIAEKGRTGREDGEGDRRQQRAESSCAPFVELAIGSSVDEKTLSADPKFRAPISMNMTKPTVGDILDVLKTNTGLEITVAAEIPRERLAYWGISYLNVPAWQVMRGLDKAVTEDGCWIKQEKGYELIGRQKPPLDSHAKARAWRFPVLSTVIFGSLLALFIVLLYTAQEKRLIGRTRVAGLEGSGPGPTHHVRTSFREGAGRVRQPIPIRSSG